MKTITLCHNLPLCLLRTMFLGIGLSAVVCGTAMSDGKPVLAVNFNEEAQSLEMAVVTSKSTGSPETQFEIKEGTQPVGDEMKPRFVVGTAEKGAAVRFNGQVGVVGQILDVEWPKAGSSFSISFKTDKGQPDFARLVECVKANGNTYISITFVRSPDDPEGGGARHLMFSCELGTMNYGKKTDVDQVTDGQWHTAIVQFDPAGGGTGAGKFTAILDGEEVGVAEVKTEPLQPPGSVNVFIGGNANGYRPFNGVIDDILLTSE